MKLPFMRAILPLLVCTVSGGAFADASADTFSDTRGTVLDIYNLSLAELGQVQTSIATGNNTALDKTPSTATIIYAAEIAAMGAHNLDEVLETVPGLHVAASSLSRLESVYSIRGIHTGFDPQVLLLMNGIPVQGGTTSGRPILFRLPVTSIDRVEVVRGPGSAVYGADAFAGVINVITKDAAAIAATRIGARTGSFNSRETWLQTAAQWKGFDVAFSATYQESAGDSSRRIDSDLQSVLDAALGTNASLAPGSLSTRYQIFDSHLTIGNENLRANLWNWLSVDMGQGAGGAQALDPTGRDDDHLFLVDLEYHFDKVSPHWDNSLRLSHFYYELAAKFNLFPAGAALPIGADGNINFLSPAGVVAFPDGLIGNPNGVTKDTGFDYISIYSGFDSQRIRLNVGMKYKTLDAGEAKNFGPGVLDKLPLPAVVGGALTDVSGTPFVFLPDSSRTITYLSLQDEWQLRPGLDLTAGVRYDHYSDFGNTTNPRVALVWAPSEKLTAKLLYGSAFRAPSFAELYEKNNPVSLGRSDLEPEEIHSEELSFNYLATPSLQASLTLFRYQAKKMIEFVDDPATPEAFKYADNIFDQDGKGFEFEMSWKPSNSVYVSGSYSRQDAANANTGVTVPDAPGQQCKATINWLLSNNWSINSQLNWVADRARAPGDLRLEIANYTLANFTLNRKNIFTDLDLSFAVRNLTDANVREPSSDTIRNDYPMESRSFWLSFSYAIK